MATESKIEWTEVTWNPVTGCDKLSAGCKNCYAERMAKRLYAMGSDRYRNIFKITLHHDLVTLPFQWKQPKIVFVNSMSDLFHKDVPLTFIQQVFTTMALCPQHTFQILTKRSQRLLELGHLLNWTDNIWMGVSVEDSRVLHRVSDLQKVPAKTRFLSCEPLIGPLNEIPLEGIDWVIVGGESGPGARPMKREWVNDILQQCRQNKTAFFFKQWGGTRKHLTGRLLDGQIYDEMPRSYQANLKHRLISAPLLMPAIQPI